MRLRRYLGGATLGVASILAVCAVLAALTSGTFFTDAEAGDIAGEPSLRDQAVSLGEVTPTPDPDPSPSPDPEPEETPEGGGGGAPDFETPSPQPEPTDVPPTEQPAPTQAAPTSTPSGGAAGGGVSPPNTGAGDGTAQDSQGWMLVTTLLAIGAAVLGAAGVLTLRRAD